MGYSIQPRRESEIRRSSIDDLPAELLGKILQYVVFAPGEFQVQLDRRGGNPYDVILVSRYWRDVAYSTPQLWVILPGHYPLLWDLIVKRSGTLELRLELYGRVPKERQIWPPKNLKGLVKSGRLQGLTVQHCSRQLMGRVLHIVPSSSSSLRYVHIAEDYDHTVWNDHAEFSTFIQSLEQVTHLVLEGGCIPSIPWSGTLPTPQILSGHPNLRCLCLRGEGSKVLRFLESATLQMLERLEILGNYLTVTEEPRRVFRDFWEGRKGTPQSLAVVYQDIHKFPGAESVHTLEITLCKSRTPGHEPEYSVDAPLLKFTAAVSMESTRNAWETLVVNEVLPLADVEEVAFKDVHMWPGRCADRLLQSLPQVKQITATGLCKIVVGALRPKEVSPSGDEHSKACQSRPLLTFSG